MDPLRIAIIAGFFASVLHAAEPPDIPRNLDFREGWANGAPAGWTLSGAGYTVEQRENCECAIIQQLSKPDQAEGALSQSIGAQLVRGATLYLSADLRVESGHAEARVWMRVHRKNKAAGLFDNLYSEPVRSGGWTRAEVSLMVAADATTIELGFSSGGPAPAWIRNISIERETGDSPRGSIGPVNLGFLDGDPSHPPMFWSAVPPSSAIVSAEGCGPGRRCAVLKPGATLSQDFDARAWREKVLRIRASVLVESAIAENKARLWLRTETPGPFGTLQRTAYHDVVTLGWQGAEVSYRIESQAVKIVIGLTVFGNAPAKIEGVGVDIVPDEQALPGKIAPSPLLPDVYSEAPAPPVSISRAMSEPLAPSPPPDVGEQKRVIDLAALKADAYTKNLPNFICTQAVERSQTQDGRNWRPRDVLTVQLGYADGAEHYKLMAINNRPTARNYFSLGGALSQGEFGSVLKDIFRPHTAEFVWARQETVRNRRTYVFGFSIGREKSDYAVQYGRSLNTANSIMVAYHGFVYLDPETGDLLRLIRIADLPSSFPVKTAYLLLDYDFNFVGEGRYLLPLTAHIELSTAKLQTRNAVSFRDYRKFEADSTIRFDDTP